MPILSRFLEWVLSAFLGALVTKVTQAIREWRANQKIKDEITQANAAVKEETVKAVTPDEREKAAQDLINRF
jgi:hypothetical protein